MSDSAPAAAAAMADLVRLMDRLRSPDGCPWDREQTWRSLLPYTVEETYEVVEAVESGDPAALRDELGDLLFHIVFHCRIAQEAGLFTLGDVAARVTDKMTRRHPHVFDAAAERLDRAGAVPERWEEIKRQERQNGQHGGSKNRTGPVSIFDDLNSRMPALLWAAKVQRKMTQAGFDWPNADGVMEKVREELAELESARRSGEPAAVAEEFGDLFFTLINLAAHLNIEPESTLRRATHKFQNRFRHIETRLHETGRSVRETDLDTLESLWQESKNTQL